MDARRGLTSAADSLRHRLKTVRLLRQALGVPGMLRVVALKVSNARVVRVRVKTFDRPITARMNNCDLPSLAEILCSDECELTLSWQPRTVLDLGANIGLTAIKFHRQFPAAALIAVEPDPGAVAICRLNLAHISNATIVHAGIGDGGAVACVNPDAPSTSRRFEACDVADPRGVPAVPIAQILRDYHCQPPVLVKMDIEGAERGCFADDATWLPLVAGILVETHDVTSETAIRARLSAEGFVITRVGEKLLGERQGAPPIEAISDPHTAANGLRA